MTRKVLLVDADVDALGALASALRARGLTVFNASDAFEAVEQAFQTRPDCVLAAKQLDGEGDLSEAFLAVPELAETPLLYLVRDKDRTLGANEIRRGDLDLVVSRISEASPRESKSSLEEVRGDLAQMPLVDLLQLLSMNRRSGTLVITTASGAGEVRLSEGEVTDAVFRRVEGEKALYRLLTEQEGRFAFSQGATTTARRITATTSMLLMEAMRQVDEVRYKKRELAPGGEALLLDEPSRRPGLSSGRPTEKTTLARELMNLLQVPRSIDELLDEIDKPDLTILEALVALASGAKLRRIPISELTTPFAPTEQLPVLRSLVTRLTRAGFAPPPRLVIAASAPRMPALAHAIRRITDAVPPNDVPPRAPLPRPLGTLRLGDGVELALTGLPTEDGFGPTWALAIPGAAAVVRLNEAGGPLLEAHCEAVEVMLIDAESLMGALDVAVPGQVAALVRSALEMAAGV
jgi:hypothetical protein